MKKLSKKQYLDLIQKYFLGCSAEEIEYDGCIDIAIDFHSDFFEEIGCEKVEDGYKLGKKMFFYCDFDRNFSWFWAIRYSKSHKKLGKYYIADGDSAFCLYNYNRSLSNAIKQFVTPHLERAFLTYIKENG